MSKPHFFTGRRKIRHDDLFITIWDGRDGTPTIRVECKLSEYDFPEDAEVSVDAHSTVYYERFALGKVSDLRAPVECRLTGLDRQARPLFRVKVFDPTSGKLLAANDRVPPIAPGEAHPNRHCILPIDWKSSAELSGEVWQVNLQDRVLVLNKDVPNLAMQVQQHDPLFEAFVFPAALRIILRDEFLDAEEIDRESEWYQFAVNVVHDDLPEEEAGRDREVFRSEVSEWIERVVGNFCEQQKFFARLQDAADNAQLRGEPS